MIIYIFIYIFICIYVQYIYTCNILAYIKSSANCPLLDIIKIQLISSSSLLSSIPGCMLFENVV